MPFDENEVKLWKEAMRMLGKLASLCYRGEHMTTKEFSSEVDKISNEYVRRHELLLEKIGE